jgi:hypothetical protein
MKIVKEKPSDKYVEILHDDKSGEVWANFYPDILDDIREKFPDNCKTVEGILEVACDNYDYCVFDEFDYLKSK